MESFIARQTVDVLKTAYSEMLNVLAIFPCHKGSADQAEYLQQSECFAIGEKQGQNRYKKQHKTKSKTILNSRAQKYKRSKKDSSHN